MGSRERFLSLVSILVNHVHFWLIVSRFGKVIILVSFRWESRNALSRILASHRVERIQDSGRLRSIIRNHRLWILVSLTMGIIIDVNCWVVLIWGKVRLALRVHAEIIILGSHQIAGVITLMRILYILQSHDWSWFVLLSHHLYGFLSTVKIEFVILLLFLVLHACVYTLILIIVVIRVVSWSSLVGFVILLWTIATSFSFIFGSHARQEELISRWRALCISSIRPKLIPLVSFCATSIVINVTHTVLHKNEVGILVRTLLCLAFLNSFMQEIDSLVVFFFELCFDALILYILETIHLGISTLSWILVNRRHRQLIGQECVTSITYSIHVAHLHFHGVVYFLGLLSLFGKLYVILVKDYFLNIVSWHLSHEKALCVAFFITLDYFIFETQKLENLLEHGRSYRSLDAKRFRHLWSRLLSVDFNGFGSVSKLVQLAKYLLCLPFEFLLKNL